MAKPLKLCRMRQISIKEKLSIFKTLAISKIVHLALVKGIPSNKTTQLNKMQREFGKTKPTILKLVLFVEKLLFENVGLKSFDMFLRMQDFYFISNSVTKD